ncbi:MAG: hypothetical protein ACYCO9_09110 [Streptosporangiaceae bacterium]
MADLAADAVADPVGVMVTLIAGVEHGLGRDAIRVVVSAVAGGRAKQRRLALALAARPAVLCDGRPPAPRAVGDLLIALVAAGASGISPPACAQCGKALRTLQRRGQDWYCSVCGQVREPCAACGEFRRVSRRDRAGRPRCAECPDGDGRDPVEVIHGIVAALDPGAGRETVADAVRRSAARPSHQQKLAWALEENPALLTGDGHLASLPSVLRLVEMLGVAGVAGVVRPSCGRCGRVVRIGKPLDGVRVCRACIARSRAEPCARCGAVREPVIREGQGRPVCANCMISDPVNLEVCVNCGRRRVVNTRSPDGPLCPGCPPLPVLECSVCGQDRPCGISRLTGLPWCPACQGLLARCSACGQDRPVGSGTLAEPRCRDCTVAAFPDCPACADSPRPGQCASCLLELRLRELLAGPDGGIRASLRPLKQALTATDPPGTALRWLAKPPVAAVLSGLAASGRDLSHSELDRLEQTPVLAHLRSVLVATGTLPPRDEQMARLERFTADVLDGRRDPGQRQVLRRYATWHLLRRLRSRNNGRPVTHEQHNVVQQRVRGAVALLDWLDARSLTLGTCGQADLDEWVSGSGASRRHDAGHFVRWAVRQRLTGVSLPAVRWQGPVLALDDDARWDAARRLLRDDTINARDRLAGLLVLLYAQPVARVSRLTTSHVNVSGTTVAIRLGTAPIALPEPVAGLARQLLEGKRGHATTGAGDPSPWLFPGGQPGRPVSSGHLGQRLKDLGIQPGPARSAALSQLASELPAALLARMLGVHIDVAVTWQRISAGDWTAYAADVSRRTTPQPVLSHEHSDSSDI